MAKLTKEELVAKINEKLADNSELAVELMEDVTDSIEDAPVTNEYEAKYNELLERYKQRFISPEKAEEELKEEVVDAPKEEEKVIDNLLLKEVLGKLEKRERQIIMLRYFEDKTQSEIGELLDISQVQVSRIEKKVLSKLKSYIS